MCILRPVAGLGSAAAAVRGGELVWHPTCGPTLYLLEGTRKDPPVLVILSCPCHGVCLAGSCLPVTHDGTCKYVEARLGDVQENSSEDGSHIPQHARCQPGPWREGGHQEQPGT